MNKREVVDRVSAISGVDPATCEVVLKGLQSVLQEELGSVGKLGAISKLMDMYNTLRNEE